jgi:transcriptional regulator with XRE-family HTH domain
MTDTQLSNRQIRAVFRRNHGSAKKLAEDLELSASTISLVLRGKGKSQKVADAARVRAAELLAGEGK